jgi:small subunit ribosomal protein S17
MSDNTQTPAAATPAKSPEGHTGHGFRRKMVGKVIRDKMNKTVTVEVVTSSRDPLYGKYVRARARYKAHDEKNEFKAGDEVEIQEHSPISKDKRWVVTRLLKKFVEE